MISALIGKTLLSIENFKNEELIFNCTDGTKFKMWHQSDCCEQVELYDVIGDLNDLIGNPVLDAREETSKDNPEGIKIEYQDSFTWTFYILRTIKGTVTLRWYGESNGYYSEDVQIDLLHN